MLFIYFFRQSQKVNQRTQKKSCFQMADETGFSIGERDKYGLFISSIISKGNQIQVKLLIMKCCQVKQILKLKSQKFGDQMRKLYIKQNFKIKKDHYLRNEYYQVK
ncbi:unnamed protein product [Paramecium sonneborni]|uniref:Uncharacterized protein n=1 Tax=Paramecium sonneborni TaxID=65129 RepID=A0A8S1PTW5_9CILI|nr:unnamed protein product [Paramecium sonneborni]